MRKDGNLTVMAREAPAADGAYAGRATLDALSDEEIERLADEDDAELGVVWDLGSTDYRPVSEIIAERLAARKAMVNMRLDKDVLAFFRAGGRGYQTRINAVLRAYMEAQRKAR